MYFKDSSNSSLNNNKYQSNDTLKQNNSLDDLLDKKIVNSSNAVLRLSRMTFSLVSSPIRITSNLFSRFSPTNSLVKVSSVEVSKSERSIDSDSELELIEGIESFDFIDKRAVIEVNKLNRFKNRIKRKEFWLNRAKVFAATPIPSHLIDKPLDDRTNHIKDVNSSQLIGIISSTQANEIDKQIREQDLIKAYSLSSYVTDSKLKNKQERHLMNITTNNQIRKKNLLHNLKLYTNKSGEVKYKVTPPTEIATQRNTILSLCEYE